MYPDIYCIGRNYVDHAKELGNQVPDKPVVFLKSNSSLAPRGASEISFISWEHDIHYECEIILEMKSKEKIAATYLGIDFTARDIQTYEKEKKISWFSSKSQKNFAYLGERFSLEENIHFSLYKNKKQVQSGNTEQMLFSFSNIISFLNEKLELKQGDLIYTGTPAGVGPVKRNDILEGFVGEQKNFSLRLL